MANNANLPEKGDKEPSEAAKPKADTTHLLDSTMTGPKGDQQQKTGADAGLERNTKALSTDGTDTYKVPPAEKQFQAIKNYGDDTKSSGAVRTMDLNLANGSSVKAFDSFDRSTGQHTYVLQNPENGHVTQYKPVDGKTLQAIDRDGKPTGDTLSVKPNQLVLKEAQDKVSQRPGEKPGEQPGKPGEGKPGEHKPGSERGEKDGAQTRGEAAAKGEAGAKGENSKVLKGEVSETEEGHAHHHGGGRRHAEQQDRLLNAKERGEAKGEHGDTKGDGKGENSANRIDGKLLAQLSNLGRFPEVRSTFAELIGKFQDGTLSGNGKEGGVFSVLQGMKTSEVDGLKAWLTDGRKNPFDFRSLDNATQQSLTKAFDVLMGRGQENTSKAMVDLNGMRSVMQDSTLMPTRTMSGERDQADLRVNIRSLDPSLQGLVERMQAKEQQQNADRANNRTEAGGRQAADAAIKAAEINRAQKEEEQITKNKRAEVEVSGAIIAGTAGSDLSTEQVKAEAQYQKELEAAQQKKLEEQAELERQEKEKQEEKKKQADEERLYIVMENDTLNSIARKFFQKADYAEIIYDRNIDNIMLQNYKDQPFAKLYPRQRIVIPNTNYVDQFRSSTRSHRHINFDKIPYASADEELAQMFGKNWNAAPRVVAQDSLGSSDEERAPIKRRSFSGKGTPVSSAARRAHVHSSLGLNQELTPNGKYVVHLGESVRSIAQKFYKAPAYWRLLAIKNNLSTETDLRGNPTVVLRRGQQLVLPDQADLDSFARNSDSPNIVALSLMEDGTFIPRMRECGYCQRVTLAMATNCVLCGVEMDTVIPVQFATAAATASGASSEMAQASPQVAQNSNQMSRAANQSLSNVTPMSQAANQVVPNVNQASQAANQVAPNASQISQAANQAPNVNQMSQANRVAPNVNQVNPVANHGAQETNELVQQNHAAQQGLHAPHAANQSAHGDNNNVQPSTILNALEDVVSQIAPVQLQEVTLTNKYQQINFSPDQQKKQEAGAKQFIHPHPPEESHPPRDKHPLPHGDLTKVELAFESGVADPLWTPAPQPELLDQYVQIIESEKLEGDRRALVVTLQILSQGQWLAVFDYQVFADVVVIHKYQRNGGRRMMKKTLPAGQAKQMAWSHFRSNWEAICKEYWST